MYNLFSYSIFLSPKMCNKHAFSPVSSNMDMYEIN